MRLASAMILFGFALAGAASAGGCEVKPPPPGRSTDLPRPRDPDVAVREELDSARRAATVEAYDLFIARHPDHPLAEVARRERAALAARAPHRPE